MASSGDLNKAEVMPKLASQWRKVPFDKAIVKAGEFVKLKSSEFHETGVFPVVDQGEKFISGYIDDEELTYKGNLPIVIFGDHTRVLKYVDFPFAVGADGTKLLRPIDDLDCKFFYYYLMALKIPPLGYSRHYKILRTIDVPIPPLPDQKRIVAKLDTLFGHLDRLRSRLDKIPVLLKQFRQAVLTQAVTGKLTEEWRRKQTTHHKKPSQSEIQQRNGHFPIPEGWSFLPLEHLCDSFQYGTSKKSDQTGKVPVLRMGNIQDGTIDWADLKYTNDTTDIATYRLEDGDVLFNRTNSPELVGKSAVYRGERPAIFAGYIIRIKTSAGLDPDFLNYYLASDYGRYWCHSVKSDGVSQSNISAKKLRSLEIPYCSREEQVEIVRRLRRLLSIADNIQSSYLSIKAIISQIPETVLSKAFMGQLIEVHVSSQMKPYVRAGKSRTRAAGREQKGKTAS